MKVLVSVIIDTYNYGHFIEQAIESVLNQDFPKEQMEIIVVDDGSTDDTGLRLKKYGKRIKYIYQENRGQAGAFNTGFRVAGGEIICLLDADDYWLPEKIKIIVEKFDKNEEIGMVQHFMQEVDETGKVIVSSFQLRKEIYNFDDYLDGKTSFTGTSGISFRKKYLEKILPVPEELFYCADEYLHNIIFYSLVYSINQVLGFKKRHGRNWFAGTIYDVKRLQNHVHVRKHIINAVESLLKVRNININRTRVYLPFELLKEEVLLYSKTGRKFTAIKVLLKFVFKHKINLRLIFIYTTLTVAIFSSRLYLKLYIVYSKYLESFRKVFRR